MHASIIVFPGSNCDRDIKVALTASMNHEPEMIWHDSNDLPKTDLIVLPGGFSYGDYLRSGAMAAHSPIMREVCKAANRGTPILAICNGFQVATEAGLLPGVLIRNASLRFICQDVWLKPNPKSSVFTSMYNDGDLVKMPIAHHDGNYFVDKTELDILKSNDQIAFQYCSSDGLLVEESNPNGSIENIAGVLNKEKNVLGMMPHPERMADLALGGIDGKIMFDGLISTLN